MEHEDPGYLDPHGRGHVVSYSLAGAASIFAPAGFNVIELPGRAWAFLAEFGPRRPVDAEALIARLWHPVAENVSMLRSARFGELIRAAASIRRAPICRAGDDGGVGAPARAGFRRKR